MVTATPKKPRSPRKHTCAICGRKWTAEEMVYSAATGERYCPVSEWTLCVRPEEGK